MQITLDISTLITLYGIIFVMLTGLVYWGKPNFLVFIQKGIIHEMETKNEELIEKAKKYSHGTRLSGPKIRIRRTLSHFQQEYTIPNSVMVVSGLAAVAWLFCLFFMVTGYVYTGIQKSVIVDIILLTAQFNLGVMIVMGWFGGNNHVEKPVLFLISLLIWWLVASVVAFAMGVFGFYFHVISSPYLHCTFYSLSLIPLIPILWAVAVVLLFHQKEKSKYKSLKNAVMAFEQFRMEESKKPKRK